MYWWKLSRKAKQNLKKQIEYTRKLPPAAPPTLEQVKEFKKEMRKWFSISDKNEGIFNVK